jgi:rod shape-determining protein MreC
MARRWFNRRLSREEGWAAAILGLVFLVGATSSFLFGVRLVGAELTAWTVGWRQYVERVKNPAATLPAELALCQGERAEFAARLATLQVTSKEYQDAARFFARTREDAWQEVLGRVVALANSSSPWYVRLDIGAEDGVATGQPVLGPAGSLMGVVEKVDANTSVVRYLGSISTRLAVSKLNSADTIGLIEGSDGEELSLNYIPKNTPLAAGDLLITSGLSGQIPAGIPVAIVKSVTDNESSPFLEATVVLLEKPSDTTTVSVLALPALPL